MQSPPSAPNVVLFGRALQLALQLALLLLLTTTTGCNRPGSEQRGGQEETHKITEPKTARKSSLRRETEWAPETSGEYPIASYPNYHETGDLDAIRKRGKLRILVDVTNTDSLHRRMTLQDVELEEARRLAKHLGLEPVVLYADQFDELIPALIAGKGDLIANNVIMTDEREKIVDFSIPIADSKLSVVSREDADEIKDDSDLSGKTMKVTRGTIYEDAAEEFVRSHPGIELELVEEDYAELLVNVSKGKLDYAITEPHVLSMVNQFRDNLKINYTFPPENQTAWAVRKQSPELLSAIDEFIYEEKLKLSLKRSTEDLDAIKKHGFLRAVTRNEPGSYYMWKGRIMGFEYELLRELAKEMDLRLDIVVAPAHEDLQKMLEQGEADIAASLLSITQRRKDEGMAFGPAYMSQRVLLVSHGKDSPTVADIRELSGKTVYVLKSSNHYDLALELQKKVPDLKIELVPETSTIHDVLEGVSRGDYPLSIADEATVKLQQEDGLNIHSDLVVQEEGNDYAWMMRSSNPELQREIDRFFRKPSTRKLVRTLTSKYFDKPLKPRQEIFSLNRKGNISPYDNLVRKYTRDYDFDWRLVVAQMFQESTFNPKAKSWVGARGLLQVMPDTGKQMGEKNLYNPENGIRAGVKYLRWLHEKFEDKGISPENQMWFTLAAYNAGLGHVYDAQDLAEEKGWNPQVWFDNVEDAMLLLSDKKYYAKARYGYARGREPYNYVRSIRARYQTYVQLLDAHKRRQQQKTAAVIMPSGTAAGHGRNPLSQELGPLLMH